MMTKERYAGILDWFSRNMQDAQTELQYDSVFHLLIAVILSAQCTDRRVNMHTPEIFRKYPTPASLAEADVEEVAEDIKSITFPNSKARHLVGMARMLVDEFSGEVPSDPSVLVRLPGVGRKTANVIASVVYDRPVIAVDTHVFRVSHRIGLVTSRCTTPLSVEKMLIAHIPQHLIATAHHWLILHGRYTCTAKAPQCAGCGLQTFCKYFCNTYKVSKEKPMLKAQT